MARNRKKKGRSVSGWVVLDKPAGMGSTEAVSKVKWLFSANKAGHAGTLDPLASGMLPIALGEATKTVPYVMEGTKVYRFTIAWGEERTTDDQEGEVVASAESRPDEAAIRAVIPRYVGIIMQVPPQFSAIKIAGERAYDIARDGETVEIPPREVEIDRLEIIEMSDADHTVFEVECGKGTYIRALARDLGRDLGCYGHVAELRRTEVAPFMPEDLVSLSELEHASPKTGDRPPQEAEDFTELDSLLIETGAALEGIPSVALNEETASRVRQGNPVIMRGGDAPLAADEACVTCRGKLVAIGEIREGRFRPRRVFKV